MRRHKRVRRDIRRCGSRRAAAIVETATVIPVLMLLAFGCADFGRVFHAQSVLANAACGGARYGSTHGFSTASQADWQAAVRACVVEEMQNLRGFAETDLILDVAATTDSDGLRVTAVQVTYPFRMFVTLDGGDTLLLTRRVEMRRSR